MINCEQPLTNFVPYSPPKQGSKPRSYIEPQEIPLNYSESSSEHQLTKSAVSKQNVFTNTITEERQTRISLALGLLNLSGSEITDEYLRALPTLYPNLKILRLSDCPNITNTGLEHLNSLSLKSIQIKNCPNSKEEMLPENVE